jgi:cytochrome c peroxidase
VGASPADAAFLPDGTLVTADRLGDTLTLVEPAAQGGARTSSLTVGQRERPSDAERGELLFYSRALVPRNTALGPLSVYACSACHDDGHIDGRRHPARRNRFRSMTKTCRGGATTAPYLSLGELATLDEFADNIVASHAQGAQSAPETFDQYPVDLPVFAGGRMTRVTLSPAEVRRALAAYLAVLPLEPSPFVAPGARALAPEARRGLSLFLRSCSGCHAPVGNTALGNRIPRPELEARILAREVAFSSPSLHDVGTPVLGDGGNNPPSLRGVWEAAPYFSDGSASTLAEVLRRTDPRQARVHDAENARRRARFSAGESLALLAFLRSL